MTKRSREETKPRRQRSRSASPSRREDSRHRKERPSSHRRRSKSKSPVSESERKEEIAKPKFELSGKLAAESNRIKGVILKYTEPAEAKLPDRRWRLYVFKNGEMMGDPIPVHRQSSYLFGRERNVCDIPVDHPSCSKQHCALQFRCVGVTDSKGEVQEMVKPYLIDLESVNGTFINKQRMEPSRYYELLEQVVFFSKGEGPYLDLDPPQSLVIDLLGGGSQRYLDHNYVWDFEKMRIRVRRDVQALRNGGFEIKVFTDSAQGPRLNSNWAQRREIDLQSLCALNSALSASPVDGRRWTPGRWRPPLCITSFLTQAFYDAGCPIYIAEDSADHEGAGLCIKTDAYGVLSSDTDFLMFPGVKRFLNFNTLRIENGDVFVDGIERTLFLRYLGISEEKVPMIVGFLGNDVFQGLSNQDKKYLEYKWKLEWLPEAAAMEINTASTHLLPENSHRALEYYKPVEPSRPFLLPEDPFESPYWRTLKEKKIFCRGVPFDSLIERSSHDVLYPLRCAVYSRSGMDNVTEYLCNVNLEPHQWQEGTAVELDVGDPSAPEPSENVLDGLALVCDFLKAMDALEDLHYRSLFAQVVHRKTFLSNVTTFPTVPAIKDLHVASLFLQAMDLLYLGAKCRQPYCWDVFHGPLFHYLCQNPSELDSMPSAVFASSFDWTEILQVYQIPEIPSKRHVN